MKTKKVKTFLCENCEKEFPLDTANKIYDDENNEVFYVCDKCVKSNYRIC